MADDRYCLVSVKRSKRGVDAKCLWRGTEQECRDHFSPLLVDPMTRFFVIQEATWEGHIPGGLDYRGHSTPMTDQEGE